MRLSCSEALDGLKLIGAINMADILERAMSLFGDEGPSKNRELRWEPMDKWSDADEATLEELDKRFYQYPDLLADLAMSYCLAHRADFSD